MTETHLPCVQLTVSLKLVVATGCCSLQFRFTAKQSLCLWATGMTHNCYGSVDFTLFRFTNWLKWGIANALVLQAQIPSRQRPQGCNHWHAETDTGNVSTQRQQWEVHGIQFHKGLMICHGLEEWIQAVGEVAHPHPLLDQKLMDGSTTSSTCH